MPITIRRALLSDASIIEEFNSRMALETEGKTLDADVLRAGVAAILTDSQKGFYLLACDDNRILGQLMITFEWSDWSNGFYWWIQSVYVRREARRQGVFRALYEHVLQTAKLDSTAIGIRLYAEEHNLAAQNTYRKLGMNQTPYLMFQRRPL